jgi:hypothetical protein
MGIGDYLSICLAVMADIRVLVIAAATIILWAALRYVGMVYGRKPARKRFGPRRSPPVRTVPPDTASPR